MKKSIFVILILASSCQQDEKLPKCYTDIAFDKGVFTVKKEVMNEQSTLIIESKTRHNQRIKFHDNGMIMSIENVVEVPKGSEYVNSWFSFTEDGNLDLNYSHFYHTNLTSIDTVPHINCVVYSDVMDNPVKYVLYADYDEHYELQDNEKVDTFYFSNDNIGSVPIFDWEFGDNNVRFIVVQEEKVGDLTKHRYTYIDKNFFIQKE